VADTELITLQVDAGVGTILLNRPPMNALSIQMQDELHAVADDASGRADVRAVVIYGGPKVFAAGADIKEMAELGYADMVARAGALTAAFDAVARIPKPVVAAVTGYALGGGCELALAADFRVVAADARLGQPEILLGLIPGAGGTQRLPRLIGPARAKDLIYSGRMVDAEEAARIGLADAVTPPAEVYEHAVAMARRYVGGPAVALRFAKAAIDGGLDTDLATGLRLESQFFAGLFGTDDGAAGMRSFVEEGPGKARFTGR
jgi:enoyl-CoA hydratase/carnithine racemase